MTNNSTTRLFVILAREAPVGVIFRRGPSEQVLLIKWNISKDHFEYGQWFKGRIYESDCSLSPSGDRLLYLARKKDKKWTAVSKPPYLTALALWSNIGMGGGGWFEHENIIQLCYYADYTIVKLVEELKSLPKNIKIKTLEEFQNNIENNPIFDSHFRNGWEMIEKGKAIEHPFDPSSKIWITYDPPITYQKLKEGFALLMQITGYHEWNGPNQVIEYSIRMPNEKNSFDLGRLDWADWDKNGDLLFSKEGRLFRLRRKSGAYNIKDAVELADFTGLKFEEKVAPKEALKW